MTLCHSVLCFATSFCCFACHSLHCAAQPCAVLQDVVCFHSAAILLLCETERNTQCYTSWQSFDGACYYISNRRDSWDIAHQDCLERGAHLTIVNNREELVGNTRGGLGFTFHWNLFLSTSVCLSVSEAS